MKGDLNKFVLLLRKWVYPYEYMDSRERFDQISLPDKKAFFSKLNKKGIIDKDYAHAEKVWEVFEIKNLGEYHDLYVLSDALLLPDVSENFRAKCIEIYAIDPSHFLSAPGLASQASLNKDRSKIRIINRPWYAIDGWRKHSRWNLSSNI